jgi:hypothetical protein
MDRRRQEIEDFEVEQARLKGQAERLLDLKQADKEAEAAKKAAEAGAMKGAEKGEPDKEATDKAEAAKTDTPEAKPGAPARTPFAAAPAPKSDEVGANAPPPPPRRPKTRPTQVDPKPGGLY